VGGFLHYYSEAAKQRRSEAAKQRSSEAAKQRSSEAAIQQEPLMLCLLLAQQNHELLSSKIPHSLAQPTKLLPSLWC
jgi:hypothetical protein